MNFSGRSLLVIAFGAVTSGCAASPAAESAPALLLGEFVDDYGIRYSIDADQWVQHPGVRYHLRAWDPADRFVVAENDSGNPGDGGLWTRIDWTILADSSEYEWAFCYAAYRAPTQAEAVLAEGTRRDTPRTGCNGYPFSRMKRIVQPEP